MVQTRHLRSKSTVHRNMACPCKMTTIRILLLVFNICLATISFFLFVAGCVLVSGKSAYGSELAFLRDHLDRRANAIGATNLDESNLDIVFITYPMGVAFLVISLVSGAVSILGMVVSIRKSLTLVIVYSAIILGVFFAKSVLLMCSYIDKEPFENNVKRMLKDSLADFTGIDGEDSVTLGWNAIMAFKQCCGVDNHDDFQVAVNWQTTIDGSGTFSNIKTPFMCCKDGTEVPSCARRSFYETDTFYDKGCYEEIWDMAISDHGSVICFVFFLMVTEFLCLFMAVWNICEAKSHNTPIKVIGFGSGRGDI